MRARVYLCIGLASLWLLVLGGCSVTEVQDYPYPKASDDALTGYALQSNKERTHFFIDGKEVGVGRKLRIRVNEQMHTVKAKPDGCIAKEELVQPPYSVEAPLSFTFLLGECEEVATSTSSYPENEPNLSPPTTPAKRPSLPPMSVPLGPVVDPGRGAEPVENITAGSLGQLYGRSYALVIGIDKYVSRKWPVLTYAEKDAKGVTEFLRGQGFEVITLYGGQATKVAIIYQMQNYLAPQLRDEDRVLIFFAGHGYTERLGGDEYGYIVPYDGGESSASYIPMDELRTQSRKMGNARHQLFIMDSCFGGLLATTRSRPIDDAVPNYLAEITRRKARQILTAGGENQQVLDGGPQGHSYFTGYLLDALKKGKADANRDGYITFSELTSYLIPIASNDYQTPGFSTFPGHELGEFLFLTHPGTTLGKRRP